MTWWKKDKSSEMVELNLTFGISGSEDEARTKIQAREETDPAFCRRFAGGGFYQVDISPSAVHRIDPGRLAWWGIGE